MQRSVLIGASVLTVIVTQVLETLSLTLSERKSFHGVNFSSLTRVYHKEWTKNKQTEKPLVAGERVQPYSGRPLYRVRQSDSLSDLIYSKLARYFQVSLRRAPLGGTPRGRPARSSTVAPTPFPPLSVTGVGRCWGEVCKHVPRPSVGVRVPVTRGVTLSETVLRA